MKCPMCAEEYMPGALFCDNCGAALASLPPAPPPPPPVVSPPPPGPAATAWRHPGTAGAFRSGQLAPATRLLRCVPGLSLIELR